MATSFDDIEDKFLILIQDYRIDKLALDDPTHLQTFLDGLLVRIIPRFDGLCLQPLSYELTERQFTSNLTYKEQEILASYMEVAWMTEVTQNITQMEGKLQNKEYKTYSEAENLKQKSEYLDRMREKTRQLISDYQISNLNRIFSEKLV